MIGGIVEVAEPDRYVSVHRGFLKVSNGDGELGRVPLDDITALILSAPQVTISKTLMVELAERKAVIVTCGRNWHPLSLTLPFAAHYQAAGVLHDQIGASEPLKKRLWQKIVKAKIAHQGAVLARHEPFHPKLSELGILERRVKSGDPENMEAQAARHYWTALMGDAFRRDRNADDANMYLNYGYTVLRAATARAVSAAGLHPALGLHHGTRHNAFALVDDLMEPFRPLIDSISREMNDEAAAIALTPETKRRLAAVLQEDLLTDKGASPLINVLGRAAQSLAESLAAKKDALEIGAIHSARHLL
ncbi:MAG: type II CRISPR-associated endonuclease Cas1 [Alphaproteobacteria bacterium]|nr:type II CRISPR-associated endonuclease Cas1 [Alphaproteobacteria bacterium]